MVLDFSKYTEFEWNDGNIRHIARHNVEIEECEEVFLYSRKIIFKDDKHSISEERFKMFGTSISGRKLSLVFTLRKNKIRVLTARDQNKKERGELNE